MNEIIVREKQYIFENIDVRYLIDKDENVSMIIVPHELSEQIQKQWNMPIPKFDARDRNMHRWDIGNIAYAHIFGEPIEQPGKTMKANTGFTFFEQEYFESGKGEGVVTYLKHIDGYILKHTLTYINGGFTVETEFINNSDSDVEIDMLSSFAMDNLSPLQADDAPDKYKFHRFLGGWSMEGRRLSQAVEELNLDRTWAGFMCGNERFGSLGSFPCNKYFPTAVFEDTDAEVCWAAQLECNSTWQMELTRFANTFSFSGGLGDRAFCGWVKKIPKGESFCAPKAYISCVRGKVNDACNALLNMQPNADELSIVFNEYCTTWGKPTQDKMLSYCQRLKELGIKYAVIDAGWCKAGCEQDGNGEWNIDKTIFPNVKEMTKQMRKMGIIPGIWFEFEVTTDGSVMFEPRYDYMKLKDNGKVIKTRGIRSYWDFRREDVRDYLYEKVIRFLKENGFGYIKVDYNGNTGLWADGAESGAEGLRRHLECVREFFIKMKQEIPDLVVENCASGGNRLEASMMNITDLSSFSDAHEAVEIPYIAANLHNLMRPSKELVWAVIHSDDDKDRIVYSLCAAFLGRVCLSGDIDKLENWQYDILKHGFDFYQKLSDIIKFGKTTVCGNRGKSMRHPTGVQIVLRKTEKEMLVVYHGFDDSDGEFEIDISDGYVSSDNFYADNAQIIDEKIIVKDIKPYTSGALLLKRK